MAWPLSNADGCQCLCLVSTVTRTWRHSSSLLWAVTGLQVCRELQGRRARRPAALAQRVRRDAPAQEGMRTQSGLPRTSIGGSWVFPCDGFVALSRLVDDGSEIEKGGGMEGDGRKGEETIRLIKKFYSCLALGCRRMS